MIGRRYAFNLTCLITGVFFTLSAAPGNFAGVCVLVCLGGIGLGGNIPIDTAIALEFLPKNRRWLLTALSLFQPLGVTVCTLLAYASIPSRICESTMDCTRSANFGWRTLTLVLGAITLGMCAQAASSLTRQLFRSILPVRLPREPQVPAATREGSAGRRGRSFDRTLQPAHDGAFDRGLPPDRCGGARAVFRRF